MKHILKDDNISEVASISTRPLIVADTNSNLFAEGAAIVPEGFVDFGLPSGTLWYNKNIGATNGDTAESWYGSYYAWGETETKSDYSWTTYQHANGTYNKLTKYCNKSNYGNDGYTDELTQLVPEDDVATVTNSAWKMPTKANFKELLAGTSSSWVENYNDIEGLNGRLFVSKTDPSISMFIPAAGYHNGSIIYGVGSCCCLWSSGLNLDYPYYAYYLDFYSDNIGLYRNDRYNGYSVRPVC